MDNISFVLNGNKVTYSGDLSARLLDVLRDNYDLTSVKCGCREGECGACSVILNGKLVNSCLIAMGFVEDSSIVTLEGYRETDRFAVIDKAFSEMSAVQCGFCTPGMVLATEVLLSSNPDPTDDEIRKAMSGNLCRCTGYNSIVRAIKLAAKEGKGSW